MFIEYLSLLLCYFHVHILGFGHFFLFKVRFLFNMCDILFIFSNLWLVMVVVIQRFNFNEVKLGFFMSYNFYIIVIRKN